MKQAALHTTALVAGIISVFVTQLIITKGWAIFDVTWGPGNLPVLPIQKIAALTSAFLAGTVGPIVAVLICRRISWIVLSLMCAFGLTIDTYAALYPLKAIDTWFRITWVISVPIQILVGTYVGSRILLAPLSRGRGAGRREAGAEPEAREQLGDSAGDGGRH